MVKAYLRFEKDQAVGVVTSRECNVAFDPTGRYCLSGSVESVGIWNLRQGVQEKTLAEKSERVSRLCVKEVSGAARCAVGYQDGTVRLWDLKACNVLQTLQGHRSSVTCLCFDKARSGGYEKNCVANFRAASVGVIRVQVGHLLASGSNDTDIIVWDLVAESGMARLRGHVDAVTSVNFWEAKIPDSRFRVADASVMRLISSSKDRLIRIWLVTGSGKFLHVWTLDDEAKTSESGDLLLATFQGAEGQGQALSFHFGHVGNLEVLLCQGSGRSLEIFRVFSDAEADQADDADGDAEAHAADEISHLQTHRCGAKALSLAWNDKTSTALLGLTNNLMESVRITATEDGENNFLEMSGYGLCGFFLAGNEHVLIGTKEGKLELYNIQIGEPFELKFRCCVSCSADRTLRFYDFEFTKGSDATVTLREQTDRSTELPDELLAVCYSANSKYINVALLNHTVVVLFEDSLKFYLSLYGHRLPVMTLDVSDDSQMIASGSADKNVRLWSTQFGNCLRSLKAHNESVMQVRFLPGTHYLATAGRDHMLKLWDCDTYELITSLTGHACEILAMALSQDAAFIVTAGNDKQIRIWKRTQEQLFLSEERAKELEDQFEQEVEREDLQATSAPRPSRRTVESVRSTERLMEVLDEAKNAEEQLAADGIDEASIAEYGQGARHPIARAIAYINTLNSTNIYEVLLALPFTHAVLLLKVILRFLEAVSAGKAEAHGQALSAAATLQTPCQAALIAAYVHHSEFASSNCRPMLLRLKQEMQGLLQAEKDRIGLTMAGLSHLQCMMKRTGIQQLEPKVGQLTGVDWDVMGCNGG
eukprot:symbB.v1.2.005115.t1/scaffold295.1/size237168/4